jgi:hypothetical protein
VLCSEYCSAVAQSLFNLADVNEITSAGKRPNVFFSAARDRAGHIGDKTMEIAQRTRFETAQRKVRSYDVTILLGYAASAIVLLIAIYLASMSPGTAPGEFVSMTVFP